MITKALAIACGILVVLLLACGWNARRLGAKIDALEAKLAVCDSANQANVKTIGELDAANNRWAATCRLPDGAQDEAVAALLAENARLARALDAARTNREVIYERDPEARAWAADGMPADVADGLWPGAGPD